MLLCVYFNIAEQIQVKKTLKFTMTKQACICATYRNVSLLLYMNASSGISLVKQVLDFLLILQFYTLLSHRQCCVILGVICCYINIDKIISGFGYHFYSSWKLSTNVFTRFSSAGGEGDSQMEMNRFWGSYRPQVIFVITALLVIILNRVV